jgi:pyridoxine 4-dehydrogenase
MIAPGGSLTLADGLTLSRMGYGAMQLAGPGVWGPPRDRAAAVAVLRAAVDAGVTHIDTSDFYGPVTVNEVIREALYPYPDGLHLVTKIGFRRGDDRSWLPASSPDELTAAVHDNLDHLGLDALNLRIDDDQTSIADRFGALAALLLIPGTSSVAHLRANLAAVDGLLPPAACRLPPWRRWTGSPAADDGISRSRANSPSRGSRPL